MQDDVNGVSWLYADLLADLGIKFYTAAINPMRVRLRRGRRGVVFIVALSTSLSVNSPAGRLACLRSAGIGTSTVRLDFQ